MVTKNTIASSADGVLSSPLRNLSGALIFVAVVYATATAGYLATGWTLNDAAYMVTLTIFSVGYDEVHPIDTVYLRALTTGTIVLGFLFSTADATDEVALGAVGIDHARVLATVLPDDAANVFITLSARYFNSKLQTIARGEAPTTESKLFHAGANKIVLPTHIGADRIAEIIMYPTTARFVGTSPQMRDLKRGLHEFGLELEVVTATADGAMTGETVGEAERRGQGAFFVVQIGRANGQSILHPGEDVRINDGDNVVLVVRGSRVAAGAIFTSPPRVVSGWDGWTYEKARAGNDRQSPTGQLSNHPISMTVILSNGYHQAIMIRKTTT